MIYISTEYIISAINQLSPVHPFLGITFLTCKKEALPIGTPVDLQLDSKTKMFMEKVHKILTDNGAEISKVDESMGLREFAYEIQEQKKVKTSVLC